MNALSRCISPRLVTLFLLLLPATLWAEAKRHTYVDLSITCDGSFQPSSRYKRDENTAPDNPLKEMETYLAKTPTMEITLAKSSYMDAKELDLDKAVKSAAAAIGKMPGVSKPMQVTANTKVSSIDAKRLSLSTVKDGKKFTIESLYILKDRSIWTVQIVFESGDEGHQQAEKILATVALAP